MKAKITKIILLLLTVALSGCVSTNPAIISQWIPPGTPQEDAIRTMKQHGYESGPCGRDWRHPIGETVFCFWHDNKMLKNSSYFFVHFKDGKVVSLDGWGTGSTFIVSAGPSSE
jgi:hypothetical protein